MSEEESSEARQQNELEALQSIYGEELLDVRVKAAWNKWSPLNLIISLTPQQGSSGCQEVYATLDLHVICDNKYPKCVPTICLENSKGLSKAKLQELQEILEKAAQELKGEEMIFQLSQYVQEFLHKNNKPASKSFYDEMLERHKEQEEKDKQAQQIEQDRQTQCMIEEVKRIRETLKSDEKNRKGSRQNSGNYEEYNTGHRFSLTSSTESSDESLCQHKQATHIDIGHRHILRGRCIEHSSDNHVVFSGIDSDSGELVVITEWIIPLSSKADFPNTQKQIYSIEQEMNYVMKLRHGNLAHYYCLKCKFEDDNFIVYVLKEFICGSSCASLFLNQSLKMDTDLLKHIAKGVLSALDYLHRNNVIHRDLSNKCVYLSDSGCIKVSNFSIHKRLSDLNTHSHTNYGKKSDIYRFGTFLLSLIQGRTVDDNNVEIPDSLQSDLYDLLQRCLAKEESERCTTSQLLHHQFFCKTILHFPLRRTNSEIEKDRNVSPEMVTADLKMLSQNLSNGQSRINSEFEFLQHLGKGAFGDVIKVRNKLDGGYYAIKRIKLNPKNRSLNKKIVREVKLLSRLNHENVVRYYNSWIETTTIKEEVDTSETSKSTEDNIPIIMRKDEFTLNDDIEALAPSMKNMEVSVVYDSKSQAAFDDSSNDDSSDDDDDWGVLSADESDSDGIEFEHDSDGKSKSVSTVSSVKHTETSDITEVVNQIDFMYIQMEFCEKSTLRTAIDDGLYLNEDRLWRLFREIVEGLAHIHQQGMIHRDLKPVNIFLDSEDHVKIGDFGLATTSIKSKQNENFLSSSVVENDKEETADESRTGLVGTILYVAPEIGISSKAVYNQKVDIYSLGVILFEMCYKPLETSMERIKILTQLRLKEILFPEDFSNEKSKLLIRWLLDHDASKRPTSQELLQSDHVPPPVLEERELRELVRHTLSNPHLKGYKYLIASCFKQPVTAAQDITYDNDPSASHYTRSLHLYEFVKQICETVFKHHGGYSFSTPLLMPKTKFYEGIESCVNLMTHFGSIVALPHDLRVPFARYVAWNGITLFRRYSIGRVYREKKVFGLQPRGLFECAFDIVTPTPGTLMGDAEILYIVYDILNRLPGIKNKHFIIRLNHTSLVKAILLHCGIKDKHQEIYTMISDIKDGKIPKQQIQNNFIALGLSDNLINVLLNFIYSDFEISKAVSVFQMITKKRQGEAGHLAKQALDDLKAICQNATTYGVTYDMVISPGCVYNIHHYSGMICQFVCEVKKKHKHKNMEVIAAGGRYDAMITSYRTILEQANIVKRGVQQSAVGISLSMDRLVQVIQKDQSDDVPSANVVDVAVCSVGSKPMIKEKAKVMRSLWDAGISSVMIESTNIKDIEEMQSELKSSHLIMLKDNEQGTIRVKSFDRERVQERIFSNNELMENMTKILRNRHDSFQENSSCFLLSRSESKTSYTERNDSSLDVDIIFMDKISSSARKRYENQINSQLDGLFKKVTGFIIVLCLSMECYLIKTLASYLEFETECHFQKSVETVLERHSKHRKSISEVCDEIYKQKVNRRNPTLVLFSLSDNGYRVIL